MAQWKIEDECLSAEDHGYYIDAHRLLEKDLDGRYEWPGHMADKKWIDFSDFEAKFREAVHKFAALLPVLDKKLLEQSIEFGRNMHKENQAYVRKSQAYCARTGKSILTMLDLEAIDREPDPLQPA